MRGAGGSKSNQIVFTEITNPIIYQQTNNNQQQQTSDFNLKKIMHSNVDDEEAKKNTERSHK